MKWINEIVQGDCLKLMKELPDKGVDAIVTDPPYGVELEYDIYNDTVDKWKDLFLAFVPEAKRVANMVIFPSCQMNLLPFIYDNYPPDWIICWHKGSPGHNSFVGFNDWEPLLVYGRNKGVNMHDYLSITNDEKMGNYGHPCPKPLRWAKWLVMRVAKDEGIILDPFTGSGTIPVACKMTGRNFIGFELSPKYVEIARGRVDEAQPPLQPLPKYTQSDLMTI